jgi:peptidoglycan-associated lipoprotein
MYRRPSLVLPVLALAVFVAACSHKPQPVAPVAPTPTPGPTPVPVQPRPVPTAVPTPSVEEIPSDVAEINRRGYLKDAFFDLDRSEIRPDARATLEADAAWLRKYPTVKLTVEGHCDERGTREYNMALGERRAGAVKDYLVTLGVEASRVRTVSYGKERPFCRENRETCWQENRRGHFVVTAR